MKLNESVIVLIILVSVVSSSYGFLNVSQCHDNDHPIEELSQRVSVGNCKKPPCRLRKNSKIPVRIKFKADEDIDKVTNSISAFIAGVPFPFPGYDQTDACPSIFSADGKTAVGCPIKKGQEYQYQKSIEVLQIYPRLKLVVHWGLTGSNNKYVFCFETPARITN